MADVSGGGGLVLDATGRPAVQGIPTSLESSTGFYERLKASIMLGATVRGISNAPLGSNGVFTSTEEVVVMRTDTGGVPTSTLHGVSGALYWAVAVYADQAGEVQFEAAFATGSNWRAFGAAIAVPAGTFTVATKHFHGCARGRFRYINGAVAQSVFELTAHTFPIGPS